MNSTESIKLSMKLTKMFFLLILYIHTLGCFWFYCVSIEHTRRLYWVPPTYIAYSLGEEDFFELNDFSKYIISFYHSTLMLTGNDIYPIGMLLTTLAAFGGIGGALVNANIFGNIAIIV